MRKSSGPHLLAAFSIFLLLAILYYHEMICWLPRGMHNSAQADRYSLAINFYDRGMNFFQPATNAEWSEGGITAPEFPAQSYLAALMGKIFGRSTISILFRLITLSFSAVAFLILFYWVRKMQSNFLISLLPPVFLFTSPVFIYYSCNYLPDTASASLVLISFYYLFTFNQGLTVRHGLLAIFFAGLATLIKTSSGVYFAAICLHGMLIVLKHYKFFGTKNILRLILSVFIATILIGGYFLHIRHMEQVVRSGIFLSAARPVDTNLHGYFTYMESLYERWRYHYLTPVHYWIVAIAVISIVISLGKWKRLEFFFIQCILNLLAAIVGFAVMGEQFYIHDYYVIAIFFPAGLFTVIFFVYLISDLPYTAIKKVVTVLSIPVMIAMCIMAYYKHQQRIDDHRNDGWFTNLKTPFEKYNIGAEEKILIGSGNPPNVGLVHADRHGLTMTPMRHYQEPNYFLRLMRQKNLKYLVLGPLQADTLNSFDSCFFKYLEPVIINEEVAIYKYKGTIEDQYWNKKYDLTGGRQQLTAFTSFEFPFHCEPASPVRRTGLYSLPLGENNTFMPQLHVNADDLPDTSASTLIVTFWAKPENAGHLNLVAQSVKEDSIMDYRLVQVAVSPVSDSSWQEINAQIPFPRIHGVAEAVEVYLWNPEGISVYIDDFLVQF